MYLIDSHVHLDASAFDTDRDDVVSRARRAGVANCVVPATLSRRWPQVRKITRIYSGCFPAYGLHPYFVERHTEEDLAQLAIWLEREPAVAVGECGLDYYLPELDRESQYRCFAAQLELAVQFQLPVIVHARKSLDGVILAIRRSGCERGVVHSFSGSRQQAEQLVALGFRLGFGGPITYQRATRLRSLVARLPLDSLLLETDAPDQPVAAYRRERNEPARLPEVLYAIAELRGEPPEVIAAATTANARKLFSLPA